MALSLLQALGRDGLVLEKGLERVFVVRHPEQK